MYDIEKEDAKTNFKSASSILGSIGGFIYEGIEAIVIALALCVVLYLFLLTPHEVVGSSMKPNFISGEYLLANKIQYKFQDPKRGDVIIFKYSETHDYIKRIIGLPGDEISIMDGKFYVNGEPLNETEYLDSTVYTRGGNKLHEGETIKVPAGYYFASGDNREHSSDSRDFGPIAKERIKGKAWVVYFPFNNFRFIAHPDFN